MAGIVAESQRIRQACLDLVSGGPRLVDVSLTSNDHYRGVSVSGDCDDPKLWGGCVGIAIVPTKLRPPIVDDSHRHCRVHGDGEAVVVIVGDAT
jgi:hypothetical protein